MTPSTLIQTFFLVGTNLFCTNIQPNISKIYLQWEKSRKMAQNYQKMAQIKYLAQTRVLLKSIAARFK